MDIINLVSLERGIMKRYNKLIFVCTGNTCRSPLAALIMEKLISPQMIEIESRGLVVLFPEPANAKAVAIARSKGLYLNNHTTKQLCGEDFGDDILVLVMTDQQKKKVYEDYDGATNVYTLKEFVGESGDVDDPYGGTLADYGECYEALERLINKVADKLFKEEEE